MADTEHELRSRGAPVGFPGVVVSFVSKHGPLSGHRWPALAEQIPVDRPVDRHSPTTSAEDDDDPAVGARPLVTAANAAGHQMVAAPARDDEPCADLPLSAIPF